MRQNFKKIRSEFDEDYIPEYKKRDIKREQRREDRRNKRNKREQFVD